MGEARPAAPCTLRSTPTPDGDPCPEFTLDLGEPMKLDCWAPQIAAWRTADVTWDEIVRGTGMNLNRAYIAWKRITGAT